MNHNASTATARLASVLATGQRPSRLQRQGRYTPESMRHPGKMLLAIAATVIEAFTRPGDLVVDPMCGIGTTVVEAIHLGRDAARVKYGPDFVHLTLGHLRHAAERSTNVTTVYSTDCGNLAHQPLLGLLDAFVRILAGSATVLCPGGVIAVTVRPIRVRGELIDLPGQVIDTAQHHGLALASRYAALLAGLRDGGLVNRASFFQMLETPPCPRLGHPRLPHRPRRPAPRPISGPGDAATCQPVPTLPSQQRANMASIRPTVTQL